MKMKKLLLLPALLLTLSVGNVDCSYHNDDNPNEYPDPQPEPEPEPEPEPAEPTTADLYARRPRKRKAVVDQLARELEAEDDAVAADAPKGGDE